jgi:flagellin-like hook-associated protein FlgL
MDVKDLRVDQSSVDPIQTNPAAQDSPSASNATPEQPDPVKVSVNGNSNQADPRSNLNEVISVVNLAGDATGEIEKLVHSLKGIVDQVDSGNIPDNRRGALEGEAQQLADAVKDQLNRAAPDGTRPLAGDPIRVRLEETIGRQLDVVLPDNAKDNLGLGQIHFSTKDAIIQTRVSVEEALQRLDQLKRSVSGGQDQLRTAAAALDVGLQNREAARSTVRDVDAALKLTRNTHQEISEHPDEALNSIGGLEKRGPSLLQPG